MVQTRKSNRTRIPTTKAKLLKDETSRTRAKPILRSISTIDEDENTYNINFKRRKIGLPKQAKISEFQSENYKISIDDDEEDDYDHEKIFNSEDEEDEYYSAVSDYESDSKTIFFSSKKSLGFNSIASHISSSTDIDIKDDLHSSVLNHMKSKYNKLNETELFDEESLTKTNFIHDFNLRSLEENFQKIINENKKLESQKSTTHKIPMELLNENIEDCKKIVQFDEFFQYSEEEESDRSTGSSDDSEHETSSKKMSSLSYRQDERHNLAFPDVSTFPIGFDSTRRAKEDRSHSRFGLVKKALNRRALLSGKASEMVGTGVNVALGEFDLIF